MENREYGYILNTKVSALSFEDTINYIDNCIKESKPGYICVCNTHSLVTGDNDPNFKTALNKARLRVPDGMPLVFGLRRLGYSKQDRVDGPNLMKKLCERSSIEDYRIFLYGGDEDTLKRLEEKLSFDYPGIKVVGSISPPYRPLTKEEEYNIEHKINSAKPDIIFVSLGCPKQEKWMYNNSDNFKGIMVGVGAAFGFILGDVKRPPAIFQKIGLEWLFRLLSEPKRLWRRYAYNNSAFIIKYIKHYKNDLKKTRS